MNETPYYRSLPSIVSFLAGGVAGVAVTALFTSPAGQERRAQMAEKRRETTDSALDLKDREALALSRKNQS
jgi:gas vesicle protein